MVKGSDANTNADVSPRRQDSEASGAESDGASELGSEVGSDGGELDGCGSGSNHAQGAGKRRRQKAVETMSNMVSQVKAFMKVSSLICQN